MLKVGDKVTICNYIKKPVGSSEIKTKIIAQRNEFNLPTGKMVEVPVISFKVNDGDEQCAIIDLGNGHGVSHALYVELEKD